MKLNKIKLNKLRIAIIAIAILALSAGGFFYFFSNNQVKAAWYSGNWQYRKKLTFNNGSYGALTNQPISIELTSANFDFGKARSDGYDIVFTDSDGTTLLTYTRETFSAGSQSARFWVKVPAIDANVNTDFVYMYYGNASAANTSSAFANSFFSGAAGYLGMEDGDRTNGQTVAESVSAENMTAVAGAGTIDSATGARGNALTFNGSDEYLTQKVHDTKQGTVTASMAATVGFINDTTQDFSPYAGASGLSKPYMIVATDSTGLKAWGYIGEQGTGETLGSELVTNGTMEAGDPPSSWTSTGGTLDGAADERTGGSGAQSLDATKLTYNSSAYQGFATVAGKMYKFTGWNRNVDATTGAQFEIASVSPTTVIYISSSNATTSWAKTSFYFVVISNTSRVYLNVVGSAGQHCRFDDISVVEVLTPSATGVKVYSTKTGTTQSWANVETGFNANSVSSYEIRKTDFQITGAMTVGAWVKGAAQSDKAILSKYETTKNKRSWNLGASDLSTSKFQVLLSSNGSSITKNYTSGLTAFDNAWHFVGFSYDGNNNLNLYVDGVLDTSTKTADTAMTTIYDVDKSIVSGAYSASYAATGFFSGSIDEPIVLPSALSADQIGAYYHNTKASQSYVSFGDQSTRGEVESGSAGLLPLAHWKFNDGQGSTAQDATANNNDGTITGSSFWKNEEDCVQGKCVYLDGTNDWVSRAYDGDFNFGTSPFTVSGWFKSDLVSSTKIIASRYSSGGWKMYLNSSGNVCFGVDDDASWEPDDYSCSSARYDNNEWHFVSAYRDTSAIYVYVDATLAGSDISLLATGSLSGSSPVLYLGIDSDGASNKFTGYLDDFKIYPYARSATQIAEDYNAPGAQRGAATKGVSFSSGSVFSGYKYRKKLTFANTSYGALTNQPVSVVLSSSNFDFTKTRSDGYDIIFTDSNGTTLLNFNRESYSAGSQSAKFWVKVPQIDAASATDYIYMYYGNGSASDRSANFSSAFFSGAAGYWGMEDGDRSAVTDTVAESVADEDMLAITPTGTIDSATGARGNALTFNGTDEYLTQKVHDTKQGTVTASMVASTAFINDEGSPGQDFTPYVGASGSSKPYMIVVTDSTGLKAWGYIGEQGTGETLDTNIATNGDMESGFSIGVANNWTKTGAISTFSQETIIIHGGSNAQKITWASGDGDSGIQQGILTAEKLYKVSAWVRSNNTRTFIAQFGGGTAQLSVSASANTWTEISGYKRASSGTFYVYVDLGQQAGDIYYFDDISVQQVLTPTTSGVKIYSTKTGTTQSWANVETGFNANSVSSYEIRKTDFQITGALTMGAWVKGAAQSDKAVLSKRETTKNKRSWELGSSDLSTSKFQVFLSSDGSSITKNYTSGLTAFDSTWHFTTFTYDGNSILNLYVDGVLDTPTKTTDTAMTTVYDSDKSIVAGSYSANYSATGFFSGSIDEPIILPSALTADQIGAYYHNTKASQDYVSFGSELNVAGSAQGGQGSVDLTTGLVGEWKLDEKSGTSAADTSGNGNTGTLTNGPVWDKGKNGGAVRLDGGDDYVGVGDF